MLASADLFVFPSVTEVVGNAVLEAKAAGLPLFVTAATAPAEAVSRAGEDGVVVTGHDPSVWARSVAPVLGDPERLARHREAARRAGALLPSWREVLEEDLVPVWRGLAGRASLRRAQSRPSAAEAAD
jgi:glycosyltransferase involved in cell wall biosynthesis